MIRLFVLLSIVVFSLDAKEHLKTFKFGYINSSMSNYSPKDLKITMDLWITEVTKNLGDVEMVFYADPQKAAQDIADGKLDFISAFPIVFVKYFDMSKLRDGFTGKYKNPQDNKFVLLVKKNFHKSKELKIGIQKNDEIMHIYAKEFFEEPKIINYVNRNRVVLELFFSKVDMAIVPYRTFKLAEELNPQISQKIKILKKTDFVSNALGFYRKGISKEDKEFIYNTGVKLFSTVKGKQMMDIYKIETLVYTKISDLEDVKILYLTYKKKEKRYK